jgi:DNA polymerase-3 subunit delta'
VGRRTTAIALAKALLCERARTCRNDSAGAPRLPDQPADFELRQACGVCADCKMVLAGSHPDLTMVYKELAAYHEDSDVRSRVMQELSIDVIRSFLIAPAGRRPSRGRGKAFIVREAELMSEAAQNALLKTLEEPPPDTTIILIAEQPEQLLPTTLSRCRMVRFGLLPRDFVMRKLRERGVGEEEARFWAAFTGGSVGRSARLAAAGMYQVKRDMIAALSAMNAAGDAELGEQLAKKTESLAEELIKATRIGETDMSKNLAIRQISGMMLELIASAFRDALTLRGGAHREIVNADQQPAAAALAGKFDVMQLASAIEQLSEMERLLWRNVNSKTVWDNVVITCASAAPLIVGD